AGTITSDYETISIEPTEFEIIDSASGDVLERGELSEDTVERLTVFVYADESGVYYETSPDPVPDPDADLVTEPRAQVRVFNAVPNLTVAGQTDPIARPDLELLYSGPEAETIGPGTPTPAPSTTDPDLQFGERSFAPTASYGRPTEPQNIAPGSYTITVATGITKQDPFGDEGDIVNEAVTVYTAPNQTFNPGTSYEILLLPDTTGTGITWRVIPHIDREPDE
ncbi:MAG: hypothetical protein GYB65_22410, partial [Chloroflexi bacterium]|nr:hypothetical protein [Chloroflexota bacterium]